MSTHLLFEGLDLAGKSTTTRNFINATAPDITWELREKSIVGHNPIREAAVSIKRDDRFTDGTMGWLHFASFLGDLDAYEPPENPVAQESVTAFRSIAYHSVFGDKDLAAKFAERLPALDIFSDVFLITAGIEARQHRLQERIRVNPKSVSFLDRLVAEEPAQFLDMEKIMFDAVNEATSAQVHIIDTGELKQDKVTAIVVGHLMAPSLFEAGRYTALSQPGQEQAVVPTSAVI